MRDIFVLYNAKELRGVIIMVSEYDTKKEAVQKLFKHPEHDHKGRAQWVKDSWEKKLKFHMGNHYSWLEWMIKEYDLQHIQDAITEMCYRFWQVSQEEKEEIPMDNSD